MKLGNGVQTDTAKNVVLFIGDGMGVSTVTATRIFDGQMRGETGEENVLSFEKFPNLALVKTYNTNQQVPDSAGTASAMQTGVKTKAGVIGVGPGVVRGNCKSALSNTLPTLGEIALGRNKAVGIVTTTRITHATPAAVFAHTPERDWESDANIPTSEREKGCQDLAQQLLAFDFNIALGGGLKNFQGKLQNGTRLTYNEDLIAIWEQEPAHRFINSAKQLNTIEAGENVLGIFSPSHMTYMAEKADGSAEPTLTQMTQAAVKHLDQENTGYFLMIEGGRIDHGHHDGRAGYALTEAREFARAVEYAVKNTNPKETLILVTADHSHVFTIAGYPTRGNDILGHVIGNEPSGKPSSHSSLAADGLPYTTLGYWNGPGAIEGIRQTPDTGLYAYQQAAIPTGSAFDKSAKYSETHGGEDVAIYATGPGSEAVHGVMEQNEIFDVITEAFGW